MKQQKIKLVIIKYEKITKFSCSNPKIGKLIDGISLAYLLSTSVNPKKKKRVLGERVKF